MEEAREPEPRTGVAGRDRGDSLSRPAAKMDSMPLLLPLCVGEKGGAAEAGRRWSESVTAAKILGPNAGSCMTAAWDGDGETEGDTGACGDDRRREGKVSDGP